MRPGAATTPLVSTELARSLLLVGPLLVYLALFYAYPLLGMLSQSVHQKVWTFAAFAELLNSEVFWRVMAITGRIAVLTTLFCLLLAYPLAFFLARRSRATANLLLILVLIPFWTSILVRTYAWMVLLGRNGIINNALIAFGLIPRPLTMLNTRFAVYVAMVHVLLPFMVLPLYATFSAMDWRLVQAAQGLGARPLAVFRQVLLPLSLPGVSAGCILVFTLAIGFYITPALVGGPSDVMISILISDEVGVLKWPLAAAMAVVLLAVVLALFAAFSRVVRIDKVF
ncbi:MAG TPA: ABC transporter permease [Acetobacteraceae bacterium]|nr:ABC transporter permease [Acetobacteraceae bacterium]